MEIPILIAIILLEAFWIYKQEQYIKLIKEYSDIYKEECQTAQDLNNHLIELLDNKNEEI